MHIEALLQALTDPGRLAALISQMSAGWLAYTALAAVVFAETGLLMGLLLPGDSLLITIGVVAGAGGLNLLDVCLILAIASFAGDQCGYFLGCRTGPAVFSRRDSRWFKQDYVVRTERFYKQHGGKALLYAKFVPVLRAFAPYMAGVAKMPYARFARFNVAGGTGWVLSMTLAGYALGSHPLIHRNFDALIAGIVLLSVLPLAWRHLRARISKKRGVQAVA